MAVEIYHPKVYVSKELREISRDFTRPEEMIREAISNSMDAGASNIEIKAYIDNSHGMEELIVDIIDDGVGMNLKELQYFFDLGRSTKRNDKQTIGEKGHGTKIFYNSNEAIIITKYLEDGNVLKATLKDPFRQLNLAVSNNKDQPPEIEFENITDEKNFYNDKISGTFIRVRGYDNNNFSTFGHHFLKDYIKWFTAWGSFKCKLSNQKKPNCKLLLKGLDADVSEDIPFGHPFPEEIFDFNKLRKKDSRRPENYFVRSWVKSRKVIGYPQNKVDVVFYVEGDSAKRTHNEMLRWPGKPNQNRYYGDGQYKISDRYGIYLSKDYIPIQRRNEDFSEKSSEWTKWHAFVNCQGFQLTANRATVENTPKDLLNKIIETAKTIINEDIISTDEYQEFSEKVAIENGRRKAELEKKQVARRIKKTKSKLKYIISKDGLELKFIEPSSEQAVIWVLSQIVALWPETFEWKVKDIDSHFGYDLLVEQPHMLTGTSDPKFIECKFLLSDSDDFNHSLSYLHQIICWETPLQDDDEIIDIQKKNCTFQSYKKDDNHNYRTYYLDGEKSNKIEVIVLRRFLEDCFNLKTV